MYKWSENIYCTMFHDSRRLNDVFSSDLIPWIHCHSCSHCYLAVCHVLSQRLYPIFLVSPSQGVALLKRMFGLFVSAGQSQRPVVISLVLVLGPFLSLTELFHVFLWLDFYSLARWLNWAFLFTESSFLHVWVIHDIFPLDVSLSRTTPESTSLSLVTDLQELLQG